MTVRPWADAFARSTAGTWESRGRHGRESVGTEMEPAAVEMMRSPRARWRNNLGAWLWSRALQLPRCYEPANCTTAKVGTTVKSSEVQRYLSGANQWLMMKSTNLTKCVAILTTARLSQRLNKKPRSGERAHTCCGCAPQTMATFAEMTAALGIAAKSLDAWRNEIIEAEKKEKEAKASGGDDQPLTVAYLDRRVREYRARNQAVCPTCLGFGDRERLRQFNDWLQRQEPEVVRGFTKWSESTPKHISGILGSETSGVKINGNSNSST